MSELVTTALGDTVAYDLRGSGPAVVFVAGAGPHRAVDPWTTQTAERAAGLCSAATRRAAGSRRTRRRTISAWPG